MKINLNKKNKKKIEKKKLRNFMIFKPQIQL